MPVDLPISGACDCHVHVVGSIDRYPQSAARTYLAKEAELESLRALAGPVGVNRFVIVQPSFYGTDNRCLLDTLDALGENGRGVAAVDTQSASPEMLQQYFERGVRGLRVNLYSHTRVGATQPLSQALEKTATILPDKGWHIEIVAPLEILKRAADAIARSKAAIVIDHYGLPGKSSPESGEGRCLLQLAALPHVWVKLSAPDRSADDSMATAPLADWLGALVSVSPDRCLWGSDWPHTPFKKYHKDPNTEAPYRKIDYERSLREFCEALAESGLARRILSANPSRLFGFALS